MGTQVYISKKPIKTCTNFRNSRRNLWDLRWAAFLDTTPAEPFIQKGKHGSSASQPNWKPPSEDRIYRMKRQTAHHKSGEWQTSKQKMDKRHKRHKQTLHQRRNTSMRGSLGARPEMQLTSCGLPDHTRPPLLQHVQQPCFRKWNNHNTAPGGTAHSSWRHCEHVPGVCQGQRQKQTVFLTMRSCQDISQTLA